MTVRMRNVIAVKDASGTRGANSPAGTTHSLVALVTDDPAHKQPGSGSVLSIIQRIARWFGGRVRFGPGIGGYGPGVAIVLPSADAARIESAHASRGESDARPHA
ncbi:hypothetical protein [Burkholderia sp. Bp9099]|uniref:hypothetical protein n=1 Tax=Burkholderia sp. Bp9099 TaxID=2184568 RepID=UPI000F5F7D62|nr:hypothetical protein [Burkholderia sp. Bp9099]RQZ44784.1 hypothetical protein DIE17_22910 [Burkholderia sp. Bp9099]